MAAFAEFRNEDGSIQTGTGIGAAEKVAFTLKQKIITNLSNLAPAGSGDVARTGATVTYSASTPLLAFSSTQPVAFLSNAQVGGTWEARFVGPAGSTAQIEVFIFDKASNTSKPPAGLNYGLELYDGAGGLIYNSHQTPFKLVEFQSYGGTYPAGRKYAVLPSVHGMFINYIFTANPPNQMWGATFQINGTTITTGSFPYQTKNVPAEWITTGGGATPFSVIDVTGL